MAEVDRVATDEVGLHLLSMMENAGRALAQEARERSSNDPITVFVGGGGNGGGGLVAARHLANAGRRVRVVLDRARDEFEGVPSRQLGVLGATDAAVTTEPGASDGLAVDALVGYGLTGALSGDAGELAATTRAFDRVLSLDVPSGRDATTGVESGPVVDPDATLTLALPKTGLAGLDGDLTLADIGIPSGVFGRARVAYADPFDGADRVPLTAA